MEGVQVEAKKARSNHGRVRPVVPGIQASEGNPIEAGAGYSSVTGETAKQERSNHMAPTEVCLGHSHCLGVPIVVIRKETNPDGFLAPHATHELTPTRWCAIFQSMLAVVLRGL